MRSCSAKVARCIADAIAKIDTVLENPEYQHGSAEMIFKLDPLLPHIESVLEGYSEAVLNAPKWTEADPPH